MEIITDRVVEQLPTASSPSSSPSHEFSFTISLHSDKTNTPPPPSFAIDLSPADEIFFHGHLLPLHLLSHLPVSPRSSTNSIDSFTLPINQDNHNHQNKPHTSNSDSNILINNNQDNKNINHSSSTEVRPKSKSFSIFGFSRRKQGIEDSEEDKKPKKKKRVRFDVIKKYMNMVLFRGGRRSRRDENVGYSSYSGNLSFRNKKEVVMMRGRRGEFSAPASIRTSPSNSGLLLPCSTSTDSSTMEDLQQAIQAAIAHCKNSIAAVNSSI